MTSQHAALSAAVNSTQAHGRLTAQDIEDTLAALDRLGYAIVRLPGNDHGRLRGELRAQRHATQAQIAHVQQRLDRLSVQDPTPEVKVSIALATMRLARLQSRLDRLTQ